MTFRLTPLLVGKFRWTDFPLKTALLIESIKYGSRFRRYEVAKWSASAFGSCEQLCHVSTLYLSCWISWNELKVFNTVAVIIEKLTNTDQVYRQSGVQFEQQLSRDSDSRYCTNYRTFLPQASLQPYVCPILTISLHVQIFDPRCWDISL